MLRTKTSRWTALTALVCLVVVAMSWFLLVSPRRGEAAEVRQEAEAARLQNDTMQTKIAQLKAQYAQLPARRAELREIYAQMPAAAAVPELIRSVTQLATASGMELKSITPQAAVQIDAKGAGAQAGASPSAAPTGGEGGTPAASPGASPATGGMRIVAVPIAISADGDYFQAVLFVKKVQTELPRAFLIDRLDINVLDHPVTASSPALTSSRSVGRDCPWSSGSSPESCFCTRRSRSVKRS